MGSCGNMDQGYFDPTKAKLLPEKGISEMGQAMSSEELFNAGIKLGFDPSESKLVPKTSRQQYGVSKTEEAFKKGQEFDFDPATGRLIPITTKKKEYIDKVEQQFRDNSSDKHFGFDKKKKCLQVETETHQPRRDRQVKVAMNKRGTGGFF